MPMMIARLLWTAACAAGGAFGFEPPKDQAENDFAIQAIAGAVTGVIGFAVTYLPKLLKLFRKPGAAPMMLLALLPLATQPACAHAPLDTTQIDAAAVEARIRVNDLAESLTETKTPILMFCGLVGEDDEKCQALRTTYDVGRQAVIAAQRYIDAFAQTGQGLAIIEAGMTVIEAAVEEIRTETERLIEEVKSHVVDGVGGAGKQGRGPDSAEVGGAGAGEATEGEGSAEAAGAGSEAHVGEGEGEPHAREVGAAP